VNTAGLNAVFWVEVVGLRPDGQLIVSNVLERAKKKVERVQAAIEKDLVYPLLRGADVLRWKAKPSISIILTHEYGQRLKAIPEKRMQVEFPKGYSYLKRFEEALRKRSGFKRYFREDAPFYSVFNIGDYSFAPWKVVWRRVANELDAAVIGSLHEKGKGRPVIPAETLILVSFEHQQEAHYLCAMINSSAARLAIRNYIVLHPDPHVLTNIGIPHFSEKNPIHARLAELSQAAHEAASKGDGGDVTRTEEEIDVVAARLWDLSENDLAEIKRSLEEV
jgi:hypothetical protein